MDKFNPPPTPNLLTLFLFWLAGVDRDTMEKCPRHDWDCVRAVAYLMIGVWLLQTGLFALVFHRILADDGTVHAELVVIAAFLATMVLLIDSFMVMRSGWHLHGIEELKRGGLDISGGPGPRIKNGVFLGLRIFLSINIAQLMAIFVSLILFHSSIVSRLDLTYGTQNAAQITAVTSQVDQTEKDAGATVDLEEGRVKALDQQLAIMRQTTIDPASSDGQVQAAMAEVARLDDEKQKRDAELAAAQTFAANELAGIKAAPGNSGRPGRGPVREGAQERVTAATAADAAAAQSLADARARLDDLRKQVAGQGDGRTREAVAQLPDLQQQLTSETSQLVAARDHLADLINNRSKLIQEGVDSAPDHIAYDSGLLAQIAALREVAQNPEIAAVIILIDLTSFGLELAAVLAKVTSFIPTQYSALLARDSYMRTVEIVNGMEEELNKGPGHVDADDEDASSAEDEQDGDGNDADGIDPNPDDGPAEKPGPANENKGARIFQFGPRSPKDGDDPPPKRPRGRPRKTPPK